MGILQLHAPPGEGTFRPRRGPSAGGVLLLLSLLASCWTDARATGEDHIISRETLEDSAGRLTILDVEMQAHEPTGKLLAKGYTDSTHWLRIKVKPAPDRSPLVLRIRPAYLDEVTLFEPEPGQPGHWRNRTIGDRLPFQRRDPPRLVSGFVIHPAATGTTYYLRLNTASSALLHAEALRPEAAERDDARWLARQGIYLGFMVCMLLWALGDYLANRQLETVFYGLYVAFAILEDLGNSGYAGLLAPVPLPWLANHFGNFMMYASTVAVLLFHRKFLLAYAPPRLGLWLLNGIMVFSALLFVPLWMGFTRPTLQLNAGLLVLLPALFLALVRLGRRESTPTRRTASIVYSVLLLSVACVMAPLLGWAEATPWHLNAASIQGLIAAGLGFLLLRQRSRQVRSERYRLGQELALSRQQVRFEQSRREEQRQFMAMLSHELKTPLSIIRMTLATAGLAGNRLSRTESAVHDMDAIIDLCLLTDRLEGNAFQPLLSHCRLPPLLRELIDASGAADRFQLICSSEPLPPCPTDARLLRTAVANLIDNALKYSSPGSRIEVELKPADHEQAPGLLLRVSNVPGPAGLPDPERVFAKYYRARRAHGQTGSGLGLYLSRIIAARLNAVIAYQPVVGGRAEFTLWLPLEPSSRAITPPR